MKSLRLCAMGLFLLLGSGHSALAAFTCTAPGGLPRSDFFQLSPLTISAGADIPVGTVVYQGRWHGASVSSGLTCSSTTDTSIWYNFSVDTNATTTVSTLSSWAGSPFSGAVYTTNIPGLGVAISRSSTGDAFTLGNAQYLSTTDLEGKLSGGKFTFILPDLTLYFSLIKIGALTPGSYSLNSAPFQIVSLRVANPRTHTAPSGAVLPNVVVQITALAQVTVSTQTCTTPDVNVDLGSYDKGQYFTGQGATTPWVDASVTMTNCPIFSGYYNASNSTLMFDSATGKESLASATNNNIGVRLTPMGNVIDAANGIMAIDSTVSGAASGVGIQLGWGESSQTPTLFNFAAEQSVMLSKDGRSTIRIPLAARYIQTAENPTPGKANGKVTFTINYY
jgi:major type 1 subunit fimbrin (pilin)